MQSNKLEDIASNIIYNEPNSLLIDFSLKENSNSSNILEIRDFIFMNKKFYYQIYLDKFYTN